MKELQRSLNKIIYRMKTSGAPCPLDQISIITLKRCPYLRTYLLEVIKAAWSAKTTPDEWKSAITILKHKKGAANDPQNFRPITLQCVFLKVYTSLIRNRTYQFLKDNGFIECSIQKGFTPKVSGTLEHTSQLAYLLRHAKKNQKSIVVTLLDLKNAFGEVDHRLISRTLEYYHIPKEIMEIIEGIYGGFITSIATKDFITPAIKFEKGVLQGDCLSPLLFNMVFNTFIQTLVKSDEIRQMNYVYHKILKPKNWFQFADDAVAITSSEYENQILLNIFTRWCTWANMIIRTDKCMSFGICKKATKSVQFKPKLFINGAAIKPIELGESFEYLGRWFNFEMDNKKHKEELTEIVTHIMNKVVSLPLHPKNQIMLYSRYLMSKLSWHLTIADIEQTWVINQLDSLAHSYLRRWLEIPANGSLSIIMLSKSQFGLDIQDISTKFKQCQVVMRQCLKKSVNKDINELAQLSNDKSRQYDSFNSTKNVLKSIRLNLANKVKENLTTQGLVMRHVWDCVLSNTKTVWSSVQKAMPRNIFNYTIRYLNNTLPNMSNMQIWGYAENKMCPLCHDPQTLGHVVAGCNIALTQGRYTWRHNSVLKIIANTLSRSCKSLYVDLPSFAFPCIVTRDQERPDIVIVQHKTVTLVELTVGFETNMAGNSTRKREKYKPLMNRLKSSYNKVVYCNVSMGACGFIEKDSKRFFELLSNLNVSDTEIKYVTKRMINICIRASYFIFCCRNKEWTNPELLDS